MSAAKGSVIVRWLGAFRPHDHTLLESIQYELGRLDEVAAEPIFSRNGTVEDSEVRSKIGLLLDKKAVVKTFRKDCWSSYGKDGRLQFGHLSKNSTHKECWVKMRPGVVIGVVTDRCPYLLRASTRQTMQMASAELGLKLYWLREGKLVELDRRLNVMH